MKIAIMRDVAPELNWDDVAGGENIREKQGVYKWDGDWINEEDCTLCVLCN